MSDNDLWQVKPSSYRPSRDFEPVTIYYCPPDRKNPDGTTTLPLHFPVLQLTEYVADPERVALEIVVVLNAREEAKRSEDRDIGSLGVAEAQQQAGVPVETAPEADRGVSVEEDEPAPEPVVDFHGLTRADLIRIIQDETEQPDVRMASARILRSAYPGEFPDDPPLSTAERALPKVTP